MATHGDLGLPQGVASFLLCFVHMLADVAGVLAMIGTVDTHKCLVVKAIIVLVVMVDLADILGL